MKNRFRAEFVAFRTLQDATPMNLEAAELICECLEAFMWKCGKSPSVIERFLAVAKLKQLETEMKNQNNEKEKLEECSVVVWYGYIYISISISRRIFF